MKIIQSYAKFENGTPRAYGDTEKESLNFYSFLFSYLTLKKYYESVRMYCNKSAQESLIKYIPYDEVKIFENPNDERFWSYYKVDVMKSMRTDFIHVDSDVFIFADLFSKFINDESYDVLTQNQVPEKDNYVNKYVQNFYDIIDPDQYDGRCLSCGVVGMRHKHKNGYIDVCEKMKKGFIDKGTTDKWFIGMVSEELALYFYCTKNKFKLYEILPYEDVLKYGEKGAGNYHNYTHMYLDTKFQPRFVKAIRMRILKDFPDAKKYVNKYENEVMSKTKIINEIL